VDEHLGALDEPARVVGPAHVAANLLDLAFEVRVVQRREIEDAHVVRVGDEPATEMEPEEPRSARDRPA
jgi:hypothetical protein